MPSGWPRREKSDANFGVGEGVGTPGTKGLSEWVKTSPFARRTSLLVSPADGQLPPLTPQAEATYKLGRSGWVVGQSYDWVDDFDSWDRCVTRGFPASMFPFRYNNGIRVFQSPGYVVIHLEMMGDRIIPIGKQAPWPGNVEAWMGNSVGHWEGKTLVIETTNINRATARPATVSKRAASPLNMATQLVPPFNTIPTSAKARTVERLTMTGPNSILYEITYTDPEVYTAPWTAQLEWTRDDSYQMFEYACHEGNVQLRNYITASRAPPGRHRGGQGPRRRTGFPRPLRAAVRSRPGRAISPSRPSGSYRSAEGVLSCGPCRLRHWPGATGVVPRLTLSVWAPRILPSMKRKLCESGMPLVELPNRQKMLITPFSSSTR